MFVPNAIIVLVTIALLTTITNYSKEEQKNNKTIEKTEIEKTITFYKNNLK